MLTTMQLAKLLVSWRKDFGVEIKGHFCVPTNREGRLMMYRNLIETLIKDHGYKEEDFDSTLMENEVIKASVNPTSDNKEKWKIVATRDWKDALDDFFPKQIREFDASSLQGRNKAKDTPQVEYAEVDPRLAKDNPVDKSIFEGLPPVNDPVDEEFMKLLKDIADE